MAIMECVFSTVKKNIAHDSDRLKQNQRSQIVNENSVDITNQSKISAVIVHFSLFCI